jgi:hypothetical protein
MRSLAPSVNTARYTVERSGTEHESLEASFAGDPLCTALGETAQKCRIAREHWRRVRATTC